MTLKLSLQRTVRDVLPLLLPILTLSPSHTGLSFIETSALDASNVELAFQQELTEIYRIVSSKALDQDTSGPAPGQGTSIPLSASTPAGEAKKGQCC